MTFDGQAWGEEIVGIVKGFVAAQVEPLLRKIKELEARPAPVSIVEAIKCADGVLRLTLSDGRMLDTGISDGAPGRDAVTPDFGAMIASALEPVRSDLEARVTERLAQIPTPRDGLDAKPEDVAVALRHVLMPDIEALVAERVAHIDIPVPTIDPAMIDESVQRAVAALPPPAAGKDADMDAVRAFVIEEVAKVAPTATDIQPLVDKAVADAVAAIPPSEPGKDADMDVVRQFIREEVANIPVPKDGETPSPEFLRDLVSPIIAEAVAALPPAAPGKDADPEDIRRMVDEAVSRVPPAKDGVTPSPEEVRAIVEDVVAQIPVPKDGEDGKSVDMDEVRTLIESSVERRVAEIPVPKDGEDGKDGRLPVVKAWEDRVYYAGDVCAFDGSTWQASVDTGRSPPHADWTCLAARGEKGRDADQIVPRGAFNEAEEYPRLSIVMLGGASFIANRDNPGPCPGEGWNLLAKQGKKGDPGEVRKGDRGVGIARVSVDESQGLLTLHKDDGTSDVIDLYPLLSRLG